MTQSASPTARPPPGEDPSAAPVAVLGVAADTETGERLRARLGGDDRIRVEAVSTPNVAPSHVDAVDCVVSEGDVAAAALLDLLATVRERDATLPFVLLATDPPRPVVDALGEAHWAEHLRPTSDVERSDPVHRRIRSLVGYRRVTALARRALAALRQGSDAVAIVGPDDAVEFVNPLFARQFGATPEELVGREWRDLFTDGEVERLETDAFPSLADGWRWVGVCVGRRDDGESFTRRTRIDALDDGGLVFTLPGAA